MTVDRKTIKRNLDDLKYFCDELDLSKIIYEPKSQNQASKEEKSDNENPHTRFDIYMEHNFTDGELRIIIESLLFSKYIAKSNRKEIIKKLEGLTSKNFNSSKDRIKDIPDKGIGNRELFMNIEELDEAISKSKQVSFNYTKYEIKDSKLQLNVSLNKDGSKKQYIINPYEIVSTNGKHYLICNNNIYDNVSHYRLDRMTNIKILDTKRKAKKEVKGLEKEFNLSEHMNEHIYMFSGESVHVTLRFNKYLLNEIADWFATSDIKFFHETEDEITARVKVNRTAMQKAS